MDGPTPVYFYQWDGNLHRYFNMSVLIAVSHTVLGKCTSWYSLALSLLVAYTLALVSSSRFLHTSGSQL